MFYCDVNSGFAILFKKGLDGRLLVVDGELVHDVFFGKVEVIFDEQEIQARNI